MKLGMPTEPTSQPTKIPTAAPKETARISASRTCLSCPVTAMMTPIPTRTGPLIDFR